MGGGEVAHSGMDGLPIVNLFGISMGSLRGMDGQHMVKMHETGWEEGHSRTEIVR